MTQTQSAYASVKEFLTRAALLAALPGLFVLAVVVEVRRRFTEAN